MSRPIGAMTDQISNTADASPLVRGTGTVLTRGLLAGVLLAGGCINGLVAQAEGNWRIEGVSTIFQFFGFGFFVPFSIYVAVRLLASVGDALPKRALGFSSLAFALLVLAPSSLVAWISVFLYAGWVALHLRQAPRFGALIFMGLAVVVIWTTVAIKAVLEPVTAFDAWMVQHVMAWLQLPMDRQGNLLISPSGHNVVILMDCATLKRLPLGLLSCVSASFLTGAIVPVRRLALALPMVALALIMMNAVRLALLSLSPEAYALVHGDVGKSIYDAIETLFVIYAGLYLGERQARENTRSKPSQVLAVG